MSVFLWINVELLSVIDVPIKYDSLEASGSTWTHQLLFVVSKKTGEPTSPDSLSWTRLSILSFEPLWITIPSPLSASVLDDANLIAIELTLIAK